MQFKDLQLIEPILKALATEGYTAPTPIQEQAIPYVLDHKDLLGCAQTGTGKTAAFAIPILQLLQAQPEIKSHRPIKALILTPTRELAIQIHESFTTYGRHLPLKSLVIYGGVGQQAQTDALRRGVDILIATPGRLLDLVNQGFIKLKGLEHFVLDEADRMLDMGFIHDVKRVIALLPEQRQTLLFSATMPAEIQKLAAKILHSPVKVEVTPESTTAEKIDQYVLFVDKAEKRNLLVHLLEEKGIDHSLVFARTKHGADRIVKELQKKRIPSAAIHGDKSQNARQRALSQFKSREIRVLVATDIAARGIDIDELAYVINYDLPNIPESYVHRIGRTGRAGLGGTAFSFCDSEETSYLTDIQKTIQKTIPIIEEHPYPLTVEKIAARQEEAGKNGKRPQRPPRPGKSPATAGASQRHSPRNKHR